MIGPMRRARVVMVFLCCVAGAAVALAQLPQSGELAGEGPFVPPTCTGAYFSDVTCLTPFDAWIEQYVRDGITAGCGGGKYCPDASVTRAQMAVFVERAMRGTADWWPGDRDGSNTGLGYQALYANPANNAVNTAVGDQALWTQSYNPGSPTGFFNTAVGYGALYHNQPTSVNNGRLNTGVGGSALQANSTGSNNSALGVSSLQANQTGDDNTAVGTASLMASTTSSNTAVGAYSLIQSQAGFRNTALGWKAGARGGDVITGYAGAPVTFANTTTGSYNTFVGIAGSTTDVSNCTAVGMDAYCDATNQVRLGNYYVSSIGGKVAWSTLSDVRAKTDIGDLGVGLALVMALRPVSYRYKGGNGRIDFGFVAQDVEAVLGDAYNVVDVGGDADRTLSLRYTDLIAPLVKAIQEQQAQIEERDARVSSLHAQIESQRAELAEVRELVRTLLTKHTDGGGTAPQ